MFEPDFIFDALVRDSEAHYPYPIPELVGVREEMIDNEVKLIEFCTRCNDVIKEGKHICSDIYFLLWNTYLKNKDKKGMEKAKERLGF